MADDSKSKLIVKATGHLARRPHSRGELKAKLLRGGDEGSVEDVLDQLEDLKLLNDAEYAYNFAFNRLNEKGWGPIKIRHALRQRCVAAGLVESALASVEQAISPRSALEACLKKYCRKCGRPTDPGSMRRLFAHLRRRGFADNLIREVLRRSDSFTADATWDETGE
jgi:regulatory protein